MMTMKLECLPSRGVRAELNRGFGRSRNGCVKNDRSGECSNTPNAGKTLEATACGTFEQRIGGSFLLRFPETGRPARAGATRWSEFPPKLVLNELWHGVHYLMTGNPWSGWGCSGFMVQGGFVVPDDEWFSRVFPTRDVARIAKYLQSLTFSRLWSCHHRDRIRSVCLAPLDESISDVRLRRECERQFDDLRKFVLLTNDRRGMLKLSVR